MATNNFWEQLPRPFFVLAPMEDVTNVIFRHVISEAARPDVFFTEFTNTESYCHPDGQMSVRGRLTYTEDEQPIVAHIWGDEPKYFEKMSIGMAEEGFKGIDINMGCPAHNVAPQGKGCGLIRRPDVAADIIKATKAGGRSEEHTSELQSRGHLVCRLLLEKKKHRNDSQSIKPCT